MAHRVHQQRPTLEVHCLGNLDRADDAIGLLAAPLLTERLSGVAAVFGYSGDPLTLIDRWSSLDALICVDAAQPLGAPGRIHRIDHSSDVRPEVVPVATTHHFGLAEALALAATCDRLPRDVVIFAIEGAIFDLGAPLTPAVANALPRLVEDVFLEVKRLKT
jgi:hydrogenase maturation protease